MVVDDDDDTHTAPSTFIPVTHQPSPCRRTRRTPDENKEIIVAAGRDVSACSKALSSFWKVSELDALELAANVEAQQNDGEVFEDEHLVSLGNEKSRAESF